jgi:hypothetical protein
MFLFDSKLNLAQRAFNMGRVYATDFRQSASGVRQASERSEE